MPRRPRLPPTPPRRPRTRPVSAARPLHLRAAAPARRAACALVCTTRCRASQQLARGSPSPRAGAVTDAPPPQPRGHRS
eukprot:scaffold47745_cov68-Phaeocystis_antarctica.AAC.4